MLMERNQSKTSSCGNDTVYVGYVPRTEIVGTMEPAAQGESETKHCFWEERILLGT
jgi:hypothetical protein